MKRALAPTLATTLAFWASVAGATPAGKRWFNTATTPVPYRVYSHDTIHNLPAGAFATRVLPAVQRAFNTWASVQCTNGKTSFNASYAGGFVSPSPAGVANAGDRINNVVWLGGIDPATNTDRWLSKYAAGTLGVTGVSWLQTGQIIDADLEMNDNQVWFDDANYTMSGYDYESTLVHEAGHFLGLDHTASAAAVMYASLRQGELRRALQLDDTNDVCTVYPATAPSGLTQGAPCTQQSECATGLSCRAPTGGTVKICTVDCSSGQACPTGLTCQPDANGGTSKACFVTTGAADYCAFCLDGSSCTSGLCARDGAGHAWCTNACTAAGGCTTGSTCVDTMTGSTCSGANQCVCVPPQGKCAGQCSVPSECVASDYTCTGGTCEAVGMPGSRCEVAKFCRSCSVCIGSEIAAYCRPCCNNGSPFCTGCTNATCSGSDACAQVTGTSSAVCVATTGSNVCEPCTSAAQCNNGAACLAGRCHVSCNPQNPGACPACLDQGSGNPGVCACSGESAPEGAACGVMSASQLVACESPNICAGGVCRAPCNILSSSTTQCPSGKSCQLASTPSGSKGACLTAQPGSVCAACDGSSCGGNGVCDQGRCRTPCSTSTGGICDGRCVTVGTHAVCACDDELAGVGQACGAGSTSVRACLPTLACTNGQCVSNGAGGGNAGSGGGNGGGRADGGTGGGINDQGCGCQSGSESLSAVLLAFACGAMKRRRARS